MGTKHLPLLDQPPGSLHADGSRNWVYPADVTGRFTRIRFWGFYVLIAVFVLGPWVQMGGHPAMFIDVAHRRFFLFGMTLNAQDVWLSFFLLTGIGFGLVVMTALWGRVWCGYFCPQTVWLEGVYRRIERLIEGARNVHMRRDAGPPSFDRAWRKVLKHALFLLVSSFIAHVFISYFVSIPALYAMVLMAPGQHWVTFLWVTALTTLFYVNFAWFREQLCLVVCPYGRLQSALLDRDSVVIGYDARRGEPRGKATDPTAGACVDCNRCVVVCPTGIDIRNGLQLECVGCAACVDACDDVMTRLHRPTGLIRYDSIHGLAGEPKRWLRPRLYLYGVLGAVGLAVASFAMAGRTTFEANLLRLRGAPFVVDGDSVQNGFELHLVNKTGETRSFQLACLDSPGMHCTIAIAEPQLAPMADGRIPVFVDYRRGTVGAHRTAKIKVTPAGDASEARVIAIPILGPP